MNDPLARQEQKEHKSNEGLDVALVFFVIRDIGIIILLNFASVIVIGYVWNHWLHRQLNPLLIHLIVLFVLMNICFTISASLARINRWLHLLLVATGVWVADYFGLFYHSDSSYGWYFAYRIFLIIIPMFFGGSLSYAIKNASSKSSA
jgi:hypothetical protein